ncbi:7-carboxy-7-deazaguanine synthase [Hyphococcus sp.]|uniref:7-carboxy-7-deazaguanine synthase n=1 Tax=Hyphococcus sp. TaxID=2038636 RepID=UPI003CCB87A3
MTYSVKELYYTLQGEGAHTGRPAVFLRFTGCNLWTGLEKDRAKAVCTFCDTDFVKTDGPGGGKFKDASALAEAVAAAWPDAHMGAARYVVCTGGEPLLQLDSPLIEALHDRGFEVGVETNGTIAAPADIDWICVSPKSTASLEQRQGNELKLVYHQSDAPPEAFSGLAFDFFFLQPMDGPARAAHTAAAVEYCKKHPQWRLSLQTHKLIGIP